MEGGVERLVEVLQDFCFAPPPLENPTVIYGLLPPNPLIASPLPFNALLTSVSEVASKFGVGLFNLELSMLLAVSWMHG
jgi:hypothetical protein